MGTDLHVDAEDDVEREHVEEHVRVDGQRSLSLPLVHVGRLLLLVAAMATGVFRNSHEKT